MKRTAGPRTVPLLKNGLIDKICRFHRRFEKFTTVKGKTSLFEGHRTAIQNDRLKTRFLDLIDIASALRAAELEDAAIIHKPPTRI